MSRYILSLLPNTLDVKKKFQSDFAIEVEHHGSLVIIVYQQLFSEHPFNENYFRHIITDFDESYESALSAKKLPVAKKSQ